MSAAVQSEKTAQLALRPVFQAICRPDGTPYAYEALMRLAGLTASPFPLIRRWERTGCIRSVDLAMLESIGDAVAQIDWCPVLAVNVSIVTIEAEHGSTAYSDALALLAAQLPGLIVELTETALIRNTTAVLQFTERCKHHGIAVALDDCQPGHVYSTVAFIERMRPEFIKLEGRFVNAAQADPDQAQAMALLIRCAHRFGALVVAEHISSKELQDFALQHGADFVQGYALGMPEKLPQENQNMILGVDITSKIKDTSALNKRTLNSDESWND